MLGRELQNRPYLSKPYTREELSEFLHRHPILKILKQRRKGYPRADKNPSAADSICRAFDFGAI